jgi:hypothetical protein
MTPRDLEERGHFFRRLERLPVAGKFGRFVNIRDFHRYLRDVHFNSGAKHMNPQTLTVKTQYTCPLTFTDADGIAVPGPVGQISSSDPSVNVSLSADGQNANCEMTLAGVTATLTWSGTGANGLFDFTVSVADAAAPAITATAGSFGTFAPGTVL